MRDLLDLADVLARGMTAWQQSIFEQEAKRIGLHALSHIKAITPVKTGLLRRRWNTEVGKEGNVVVIWLKNNTKYAAAVNYGRRKSKNGKSTGKTRGAYMLESGLANYKRADYHRDMEKMLERLKEAFR